MLADATQDALTAAFAARLFSSAPVVVVSADSGAALRTAEKAATAACAPLLLGSARPSAPLLAELKGLRPRDILARVRVLAPFRVAGRVVHPGEFAEVPEWLVSGLRVTGHAEKV